MKLIAIKYIFFLFILLLNHSVYSAAAVFKLPPNHKSTYQLEKFNTHVGEMQNTLNYQNGIIRYSSIAKAEGIATFFVSSDATEVSLLSWPQSTPFNWPQQQSFHFIQEEGHKKNQYIEFKLNAANQTQIEGKYKFKPYSFTSDKKLWSRQLLLLLISSDFQLNPDSLSNHFFIADKGLIKKYTYTVLGDENIKYQNKTLAALKIKIVQENSNRMSYVWLSKTQFYLPLKIEQYKGEDLNIRMHLTQLELKKDD